jgi:hypothetical protein
MSRKQHKSERPTVPAAPPAVVQAAVPLVTPVFNASKSGSAHFVRHKYNERGELAE